MSTVLPWVAVNGDATKQPVNMLATARQDGLEYVVWLMESLKVRGQVVFTAAERTRTNDRRIKFHHRVTEIPSLEQAMYLCQQWADARKVIAA